MNKKPSHTAARIATTIGTELRRSLVVTRFAIPAIAIVSLFATGGATGGNVTQSRAMTVSQVAPRPASVSPMVIKPVETTKAVELIHDASTEEVESDPSAGMSTEASDDTSGNVPAIFSSQHTMVMEVTAYCACTRCCGPDAAGVTASGRDVSYNDGRFVAADTTVLPFNTRISIPGYHDGTPVEVIDRGGAIKGNRLDVYFPTHEEAMLWGRRIVTITIQD